MLIRNKRDFLARRLIDLGIIRLVERIGRRPSLLAVTYHRIGKPTESPYFDGVDSASAAAFREQVKYLRDHFELIGVDRAIALVDSGFAVNQPTALITFDDGYRDNAEVAFPILQELGIPATFFLPTAFLNVPRLPWWDHTAFVLKRSEREWFTLEWPEPLTIDLRQEPRAQAIMQVIRLYLDGKVTDEGRFRHHLEECAGVPVDEETLGRTLFMTWDQARELAKAGMSIGSHAHTHRKLAALSESEQRSELTESKQMLERTIGCAVQALAYPFGWAGTYSAETKRLAAEAGYQLAFSSQVGVNRPGVTDHFALYRLGVGFGDSVPLFRGRTALQAAFGTSFL